jgi:hypothetical protein
MLQFLIIDNKKRCLRYDKKLNIKWTTRRDERRK